MLENRNREWIGNTGNLTEGHKGQINPRVPLLDPVFVTFVIFCEICFPIGSFLSVFASWREIYFFG
jgi:hypothetical protein